MITIFLKNKDFKIDIYKYILYYVDEYIKLNKDNFDYYYNEYNRIKQIDIDIPIKDEFEKYKIEEPLFTDLNKC